MPSRQDLSRRFILDVCANGSVAIRERGHVIGDGRLPLFSTATYDEAHDLRVFHCRLARDGSGVYFLNNKPDEAGDLGPVVDMFRQSYARMEGASRATSKAAEQHPGPNIEVIRGLAERWAQHPGVTVTHAVTLGSRLRGLSGSPPGRLRWARLQGLERDIEPTDDTTSEPLTIAERDMLIGWVRRAMQAEHDRRRAHGCDGPRWAVYIGDMLGIRSDDNAGGPVAGAWALCEAAGWPS